MVKCHLSTTQNWVVCIVQNSVVHCCLVVIHVSGQSQLVQTFISGQSWLLFMVQTSTLIQISTFKEVCVLVTLSFECVYGVFWCMVHHRSVAAWLSCCTVAMRWFRDRGSVLASCRLFIDMQYKVMVRTYILIDAGEPLHIFVCSPLSEWGAASVHTLRPRVLLKVQLSLV